MSFVSGLSIIYFVGVYGKGVPVDSSTCIDLMVLVLPSWQEFDPLFCVAGVWLVSYHRDMG